MKRSKTQNYVRVTRHHFGKKRIWGYVLENSGCAILRGFFDYVDFPETDVSAANKAAEKAIKAEVEELFPKLKFFVQPGQ